MNADPARPVALARPSRAWWETYYALERARGWLRGDAHRYGVTPDRGNVGTADALLETLRAALARGGATVEVALPAEAWRDGIAAIGLGIALAQGAWRDALAHPEVPRDPEIDRYPEVEAAWRAFLVDLPPELLTSAQPAAVPFLATVPNRPAAPRLEDVDGAYLDAAEAIRGTRPEPSAVVVRDGQYLSTDPNFPGGHLAATRPELLVAWSPDAADALAAVADEARRMAEVHAAARRARVRRAAGHLAAEIAAASEVAPDTATFYDVARCALGEPPVACQLADDVPGTVTAVPIFPAEDPVRWTPGLLVPESEANHTRLAAFASRIAGAHAQAERAGRAIARARAERTVRALVAERGWATVAGPGGGAPRSPAGGRSARDEDAIRAKAGGPLHGAAPRTGEVPRRGSTTRDTADEWDRKVSGFKGSRHTEAREPGRVVNAELGWAEPLPRPGERVVLNIYGSHWLMEVVDPPGWGFRLVNLVVDGESLSWDLPGFDRREAEKIAVLLVDNYI